MSDDENDDWVYVCPSCGYEDDPDRFGNNCPRCGEDLTQYDDEDQSS